TNHSIWTERNRRPHDGLTTSPISILKQLDRLVRDAILGRRQRKRFRNLMLAWLKYE
ncbi:hypothetical protein F2Q70_00034547, partial [Brassica cretica]